MHKLGTRRGFSCLRRKSQPNGQLCLSGKTWGTRRSPASLIPERKLTTVRVPAGAKTNRNTPRFFWDCHQRKIAKQALKTVREGAFTALRTLLPSIETKNAKSAFQHGLLLTDTIGHWVKCKMVAGPFDEPPLENFRANPLIAVQQKAKVHLILNLSAPKNFSFNDAVDDHRVRKLIMSSASLFAKALRRAGRGALMAKFDICDAYCTNKSLVTLRSGQLLGSAG